MGNCLRSEAKLVKIMKIDGKILEYSPSIKVNQVLSEFKDHAVSEMVPVSQYMKLDAELEGGQLYYLIPLPAPPPPPPSKVPKKKVSFSEPDQAEQTKASFRIKLVISKQELKDMLESGIISMDGLVQQNLAKSTVEELTTDQNQYCSNSKAWKPLLMSIPEV